MVDPGAYVAIIVFPGALTTLSHWIQQPQEGLPIGEAAWRALARSCLLTVLLAAGQQVFPGSAALGDVPVFTPSSLHLL